MSGVQRLIPSKGAHMLRDEDGPYMRYLDHVEELARVEAVAAHRRAVLSTVPLNITAEKLKAEAARLRAENAALRAELILRTESAEAQAIVAGPARETPRHNLRCDTRPTVAATKRPDGAPTR